MKALRYLQENPRIKGRECNIAYLGASINLNMIINISIWYFLHLENWRKVTFMLLTSVCLPLCLCLSMVHMLFRITLNIYNGVPGYCRLWKGSLKAPPNNSLWAIHLMRYLGRLLRCRPYFHTVTSNLKYLSTTENFPAKDCKPNCGQLFHSFLNSI